MPGQSTSGGTRHHRGPESKKHGQKGGTGMTAAFLSSGSTSTKNNRATCVLCKGGHFFRPMPRNQRHEFRSEKRKKNLGFVLYAWVASTFQEFARNIATFVRGSIMQYYVKNANPAITQSPREKTQFYIPRPDMTMTPTTLEFLMLILRH